MGNESLLGPIIFKVDVPQIPWSRNCGFPLNEEMTPYLCFFGLDFVYIVDVVKLFMIFT